MAELRTDYITVITGLAKELNMVFDVYDAVVSDCDFGVGDRGDISFEELLSCLEDYRLN